MVKAEGHKKQPERVTINHTNEENVICFITIITESNYYFHHVSVHHLVLPVMKDIKK